MSEPIVTVCSSLSVREELVERVAGYLPETSARRIVIKPNWVRHAEHAHFPIEALVTDTSLVEAAVEACLRKYPKAEEILVADTPLQDCAWHVLMQQTGIDALSARYAERTGTPRVTFRDLRRERFRSEQGFLHADTEGTFGDCSGYREVVLGAESFLDAASEGRPRFGVSDFDSKLTAASHGKGFHRYLVSGSVLEADLIINLPKMKTHQKAGITGALKNLVGIVGQKAYLVHYRKGSPRRGGDEFAPETSRLVLLQVFMRGLLQKRFPFLFSGCRRIWQMCKRLSGITTEGTPGNLRSDRFYLAGGAWYGNDTIWRMIYDLNRIVRYADRNGVMQAEPQRDYVAICDGVVAGEGNGPLQPLPVDAGVLLFSRDPFALDMAMSRLMGLDFRKIPQLRNHTRFDDPLWGRFDPLSMCVRRDGEDVSGLASLPVCHAFMPPPGWKGHIEWEDNA